MLGYGVYYVRECGHRDAAVYRDAESTRGCYPDGRPCSAEGSSTRRFASSWRRGELLHDSYRAPRFHRCSGGFGATSTRKPFAALQHSFGGAVGVRTRAFLERPPQSSGPPTARLAWAKAAARSATAVAMPKGIGDFVVWLTWTQVSKSVSNRRGRAPLRWRRRGAAFCRRWTDALGCPSLRDGKRVKCAPPCTLACSSPPRPHLIPWCSRSPVSTHWP